MHQEHLVDDFRDLANVCVDIQLISNKFEKEITEALLIRSTENKLLQLFDSGSMNGTIHTCVGQEFSAVAVCSDLNKQDWVSSNHRCHGHYISKTKHWKSLIDELRGLKSGTCGGIGSSQHLFDDGFLSNGPQGSLLPVSAGIALHLKESFSENIAVSFVGEGTLGQGIFYETLNIASILELPHLIVLENNLYSQSTPQADGVAGDIKNRAESFGIKTYEADTWDLENLFKVCDEAKDYVRSKKKPAFLKIKTYRLNAHSKSDDDRDNAELSYFKQRDPLENLLKEENWKIVQREIETKINNYISSSSNEILTLEEYSRTQIPEELHKERRGLNNPKKRMVHSLNETYLSQLEMGSYFIGEDIKDPYGGAFKVTKGFSSLNNKLVKSTPISESAIVGVGIGLSLMGNKPFIEIMFGDFVTHIFDQLISNASKFFHMYSFKASCPVRIRTPMGGKRGYGPTHSQSLEKFFLGIDNLVVVALTSLEEPSEIISELQKLDCPAIIIENKTDYGKTLFQTNEFLKIDKIGHPFGSIHAYPIEGEPDITIISYGGTAREIVDASLEIYLETEILIETFCLTSLNPLRIDPLLDSIKSSKGLLVVEDHSVDFGLGSEILAKLSELNIAKPCKRLGARPVPIPSVKELEEKVLPTKDVIIDVLKEFYRGIK